MSWKKIRMTFSKSSRVQLVTACCKWSCRLLMKVQVINVLILQICSESSKASSKTPISLRNDSCWTWPTLISSRPDGSISCGKMSFSTLCGIEEFLAKWISLCLLFARKKKCQKSVKNCLQTKKSSGLSGNKCKLLDGPLATSVTLNQSKKLWCVQ